MSSYKITIITNDGATRSKKIATLNKRFQLISNYITQFTESWVIWIEISSEEWNLIYQFTNTLETPITKPQWVSLIKAANYLLLTPCYSDILRRYTKKHLEKEKIYCSDKEITLEQIGNKLENSKYLTLTEQRCQYKYWNGSHSGVQCSNPALPDKKYCEACISTYSFF